MIKKFFKLITWQRLTEYHFILLGYKFKYFFIIFTSFFQWINILIFDYYELLSEWFPYGVNLVNISIRDLMLVYNVFGANIIFINILILFFINHNSFCLNLDKKKLFDSFKNDLFYWICFSFILFFTTFFIFTDPTNGIIHLHYFYLPLGAPFKEILLDSFHSRYCLLCIYKLLVIYLVFGSKNLSLRYRLSVWFALTFFIKLAYLNSCFIVDSGLFFLVANPYFANLNTFEWDVFLKAFLA